MKLKNILTFILLADMTKNTYAQNFNNINPSVTERITDFYHKWLHDDTSEQLALLEDEYLTPEMKRKWRRLTAVYGCDPFLRAQDYTEYTSKSLQCTPLEGDWYCVSFRHEENAAKILIPLKVTTEGEQGKIRVAYVVPEWGGTQYGDSLLPQKTTSKKIVSKTNKCDAEMFIKSFYQHYTGIYARMDNAMEQALKELREQHCTPELNTKFKDAANFNKEECGSDSYDLLVNNFDFDAFWCKTFTIEATGKDTFNVSYKYSPDDTFSTSFQVKVCEKNGYYKIEDIIL